MAICKKIADKVGFTPRNLVGYTDVELTKIEDFYGICIIGQLKEFFKVMGRSSGNVQFNCFLIAYTGYHTKHSPATVSGHVASQLDFRGKLLGHARPFLTGSPFLFAIEYETQYMFLRTKADQPLRSIVPNDDYSSLSADPNIIYRFDENTGLVENTGICLEDYLVGETAEEPSKTCGAGEMINI